MIIRTPKVKISKFEQNGNKAHVSLEQILPSTPDQHQDTKFPMVNFYSLF